MTELIPPERSIFISYAHEDRKILEGLRKPLLSIQNRFKIQLVWDDSRLKTGDTWEREIQIYLMNAPVAILLLSQNFTASEYIQNTELPILLERHGRDEVTLLPVIAGRVDLDLIGLNDFETIPPPERPLQSLDKAHREEYYYQLGLRVKEILMQLSPALETAATPSLNAPGEVVTRLATAFGPSQPRSWKLAVPAEMATDEIEHQLRRLITQTKHRGFLIFSRGALYTQYAYYKEFDTTSVIIEVISNAYLPADFQLSKLQMQHLSELGFTQWSDEENLMLLAPIESEDALGKLSVITWHILDNILNCRWDSDLEVSGQCW